MVIHTPALDVLLIERADKAGYWQSVTGSRHSPDEVFLQVLGLAAERYADLKSRKVI